MQVEVYEYGNDADDYYVVYKITGLNQADQKKLINKVDGAVEIRNGDFFVTNHYDRKYFPFGSEAAQMRMDDFIAREEIEMTVYLSSLLEDE